MPSGVFSIGLERELIVREFMNYLALHRDTLVYDLVEESDGTFAYEASGNNANSDETELNLFHERASCGSKGPRGMPFPYRLAQSFVPEYHGLL